MIISRTPFRISFFGGGTDYPVWYKENGGAVLSTTINKYCYLNCREFPPFFDMKSRIVWAKIESVNSVDEIQHPSVREVIKFLNLSDTGLEVHHSADLPARSGMGASSSFTVGILNALYALKGEMAGKRKLALDAIHVEQDLMKENVGSQDQAAAAYGGFNKIIFGGDNHIEVLPVGVPSQQLAELQGNLMLFFTGLTKLTTEITPEQIKNTPKKSAELNQMRKLVDDAVKTLSNNGDIDDFGRLLHETWQLKRSLSSKITNKEIDDIYEAGMAAGALGGKLLGAGGGGFILFYVQPGNQAKVKEALKHLIHVPFKFESSGSQIIHYQPK